MAERAEKVSLCRLVLACVAIRSRHFVAEINGHAKEPVGTPSTLRAFASGDGAARGTMSFKPMGAGGIRFPHLPHRCSGHRKYGLDVPLHVVELSRCGLPVPMLPHNSNEMPALDAADDAPVRPEREP
jgi:hypothetical protein